MDPGDLGIKFANQNPMDGTIDHLTKDCESNLRMMSVCRGTRIVKLDGRSFSYQRLDKCCTGETPYSITFQFLVTKKIIQFFNNHEVQVFLSLSFFFCSSSF